ncbi:non-ribosomal peptide synthetase [Sphingobacterium sp. DR205]|uniref:non-ribosomal peptide synthetase n=1 Tax=Sphingobacterium sp. DR205 TaxID=2713573 RepID=UPI0013E457F9|nr:non-ribosomal peptide synthetase [Sphingobacterium sp. DR205]QIH33413.1 amino acid adenylation domain-containing protein [Sphingobacterium sp. DR205]
MANKHTIDTEIYSYPSTIYWKGVISNYQLFSSNFGERKKTNLCIDRGSLSFLQALTSGNERALQTVSLTIFESLVKRFFVDRTICKIYSTQSDILLYPFIDAGSDDLKEYLLGVKGRFLEVMKYIGYDRDEISLDAFSDCTFSFDCPSLRSPFDSFELNMLFSEDKISLCLLYDESKIESYFANHFLKYFGYILAHLEAFFTGEQSIHYFLIPEDESLIASTNSTTHDYPKNQTVITIFEDRVKVNPNSLAIKCKGFHLTYLDFNEQVNKFCDFLKRVYGTSLGDIVGLDLSRSEQMVISIFGILKAGAAYLPIDPKLPQARKDFIIEDSKAKLIVDDLVMDTFNTTAHKFSSVNPSIRSGINDLAYVIYTSGSTGRPKGVMLEHGGLINRLFWMQDSYKLTDKDVLIQKTNYAFDVSVWEMFWWSLLGASLYIPLDGIEKDPKVLVENIHQENITVIHFVPSMLAVFLDYLFKNMEVLKRLGNLKQVYVSGEALPNKVRDDFFKLLPSISLKNLYGPTEATIDVTSFDCRNDVAGSNSIPIGKPIWNTKVHILDDQQRPVPVAVVGNLYIESIGLARGYLNREDLTKDKFIDNPKFSRRIYNSGDLARWLPDGNIEFIGRSDFQIKIRGNRVELGDIENTMLSYCDTISQAIVIANESGGGLILIGYYTSRGNTIDRAIMRSFLQDRLPEYMVPSYLVELNSIPLTANGKVDRKALPSVIGGDLIRREYKAAKNITEETLVDIWQEVLGVEKVGTNDNFFDLGGHSLKVAQVLNKVRQRLSREISFRDFFEKPTIEGVSEKLKAKEYRPIPRVAEQESYPLTPSQRRLWVLSQLEGGSQAYNMPAAVKLKGNLKIELLEKAFLHLIDRHEILRTSFRAGSLSGDVNQYISKVGDIEFNIREFDFTEKSNDEIEKYLNASNKEPFDLENAPLLKVLLLKRYDEEYILFLSIHHLVGDGWSTELLVSEVVGTYNLLLRGEEPWGSDIPLPIQYRDYAGWLEEGKEQDNYKRAESYWLDQFNGKLPVLNLPSYRVRSLIQTYNGNHVKHIFSEEFTSRLIVFCQRHGVTMFMTLMTGIKGLLYRYTGEEDIIVGMPVAGREHPDLENQIGLYLNTLAIRTKFDGQKNSFASLLQRVKESLLSAYEHQCYPFDELVGKLDIRSDRSRSVLFDVLVVLQNQNQVQLGLEKEDLEGIQVERYDYLRNTSQFDISYSFLEEAGRLSLTIGYNTDIYDRFFIDQMFGHFENLLNASFENDEIDISTIEILSGQERLRLLREFNDNRIEYPKDISVVELFERQAMKTPNHIAVVFEGIEISYRELNHRSNKLGYYLRTNFSINEASLVAIKLENGSRLIETVLGILKSGAGYIPIDPESPKERVDYILNDTKAKIVIDDDFLLAFDSSAVNCRQVNLPPYSQPEGLTYVIYTSGSTGQPKGVKINSLNILDYFYGLKNKINLTEINSYGMMSTIATDLGNTVLFSSLFEGKTLHLFTKNQLRDFDYIKTYFNKHSIDCIKIVPSLWKALNLDDNIKSPCKKVIFGGEALGQEIITRLHSVRPEIQIVNHYGPTETTIGKTLSIIGSNYSGEQVPIGNAFSNTSLFVVDEKMQLVPIGVSGELLIGGDGVSEGYLNNSSLTAQKFIVFNGIKVYKTGDIVRWLPDGQIEFLGRKDFQVKIQGHRIELGEIESNVSLFGQGISHAVADVKEVNGDKVLVIYYSTRGNNQIDKLKLRTFLEVSLPEYMVPSYFVQINKIPLTSNGKIDRRALPIVTDQDLLRRRYEAPRNFTQETLVDIWQEVLGIEKVGITDNFFELGGHSLMVAQVLNRVYQNLAMQVSVKDFFAFPTIESITRNFVKKKYTSIPKAPKKENYPLTPSQQRLWVLSQLEGGAKASNMPAVVTLKGELNKDYFEKAFKLFIDKHEITRTLFRADRKSGEIYQYIIPKEEINFQINLLDFIEKTDFDIEDYLYQANKAIFRLDEAPLIRASLLKKKSDEYIFFLSMHHIIGDGWSTQLLIAEVVGNYNKLCLGEENNDLAYIDPEAIQYKDYAVWLQNEIKGEKYKKAESYWLEQFHGDLPVLELPSYKIRPLVKTYNGNNIFHVFSKEFTETLKSFSTQHGVTLFITLMAGVRALLYRYTGQRDIIIGTPIAGREHPDLENQIGLYLNTLAIRTKLKSGNNSFISLLQKEKDTLLFGYENQIYPFDELVNRLNLKRDASRSALFDVLVVLQNQNQLELGNKVKDLRGIHVEEYNYPRKTSQFDMSCIFTEADEQIKLDIIYNTDIYDEPLINRMFSHFENLITQMVKADSDFIENIDFLTKDERRQVIFGFNDTDVEYPKEKSIIQLFEEQVSKKPDNIAIVFGNKKLSYKDLNEQANQLGDYLKQNYKIQQDDLIAVKLFRSEKLIVAILGILKSGAAYVPIDPEYPEDRINYMINDTKAKAIIDAEFLKTFIEAKDHYTKANLDIVIKPDSLSHIIYTSGTTGNPKGVMIEHRNLRARMHYLMQKYNLNADDNLIFYRSYSFDGTIEEYLLPFIVGARSFIAPINFKEDLINNMIKFIYDNKISKINIPPVLLGDFIKVVGDNAIEKISSLNHIISGGDELTNKLCNLYFSKVSISLYNTYGPTENTIDSTNWMAKDHFSANMRIPIGKPIENTKIYILDENLQVVPTGVLGELYVGGSGLARGYLNRPDLTKENFIPNPFIEQERIYKTGDLGRWQSDGNIEFWGRRDFQANIRGFRVELGEIEKFVYQYSNSINQVVAESKQIKDEKVLVVYYSCNKENKIDKVKLREYLLEQLPYYMIPGFFVELESIPLTNHGKIDRRMLPDVTEETIIKREYVPPRNKTEEKLVKIWEEILKVEKVGVTDDFFELGGTSITVLQLIPKIKKYFDFQLHFNYIYYNSTIDNFIKNIPNVKEQNIIDPMQLNNDEYLASYEQKRIWDKVKEQKADIRDYNICNGYHIKNVDIKLFAQRCEDIINEYKILRGFFVQKDSELVIKTLPPIKMNILPHDKNMHFEDIYDSELNTFFDIDGCDYLIKIVCYEINNTDFVFFIVFSHILVDGWSTNILLNRILKGTNFIEKYSYESYADWQRKSLTVESSAKYFDIWEKYDDAVKKPAIPFSKTMTTDASNSLTRIINGETLLKVQQLLEREKISLNSLILLAITYSYYNITGEKTYNTNIVFTGRVLEEFNTTIGLIRNTILAEFYLIDEWKIRANIKHFEALYKKFLQYQNIPIGYLLDRRPELFPLTDGFSFVSVINAEVLNNDLGYLYPVKPIYGHNSAVVMRNDMTFHVHLQLNILEIKCAFKPEVYNIKDAELFLNTLIKNINVLIG